MGFIYSILNKSNGKIYVGLTEQGKNRFTQHRYKLRKNIHQNPHLQSSWNKYGEYVFEFNILEHCPDEKLGENEDWWINYFDSKNPKKGYNLKDGGNSGFKFREDARKRMSSSHMGKFHSDETKKRMSDAHKGVKKSKEHCRHISESKKGSKNPMYGKCGELSPSYGKCKELSPVWKSYPRIVKYGFRNGNQVYGIKYDGKIIKTSIYLDKLEKHLDEIKSSES